MRFHWRLPALTQSTRYLLLITILLAIFLFMNLSSSEQSSASLEREISRLSVYYVRALAREKGLNNLPPSDDLQKTMPILIRSLILRLNNLESSEWANLTMIRTKHRSASVMDVEQAEVDKKLSEVTKWAIEAEQNQFSKFCAYSVVRAAVKRSDGKCSLPDDWRISHPECEGKRDWMSKFHNSHQCYKDLGVDDTQCAAIFYLSEVEFFCPRSLDFHAPFTSAKPLLGDLTTLLVHAPLSIRRRVEMEWLRWEHAASKMPRGSRLRFALYRGKKASPAYLETLMWADLAAALHSLGHDMIWIHDQSRLQTLLKALPSSKPDNPCPTRPSVFLDSLYTDEEGRQDIEKLLGQSFTQTSCILRIVSPDGEIFKRELPPSGMVWRQYLTAYPTMDDHTFLGFAVTRRRSRAVREFALVLGSSLNDFATAGPYLKAVSKRFPILTVIKDPAITRQVARRLSPHLAITNKVKSVESLIDSAALLVGLGNPLNDPLILEAMARGVIFLNPRFLHPAKMSNVSEQSNQNSQHTYVEKFVPKTASLLVDPLKPEIVEKEVQQAQSGRSYVPHEFTHSGYLERLSVFLKNMNCCTPSNHLDPQWPPASAVEYFLGIPGDSCEVTCYKRNRKCEPAYFPSINSRMELDERGVQCSSVYFRSNPLFPAVDATTKVCHFQSSILRYSCFHSPLTSSLQRICPCRDVKKDQVALCKTC